MYGGYALADRPAIAERVGHVDFSPALARLHSLLPVQVHDASASRVDRATPEVETSGKARITPPTTV